MSIKTSSPKDFLWDGAAVVNQLEGGYDEGREGLSVADITTAGSSNKPQTLIHMSNGKAGKTPVMSGAGLPQGAKGAILSGEYYPNHVAIDFYHHYKEDIKLFAEMGFKTFRMSTAWTKILPRGDEEEPNQTGPGFYRKVLEELKKYNIEPLITISHYGDPLYLGERYNDWQDRAIIDEYVKYAKVLSKEYRGLVKYWLAFSGINCSLLMPNVFEQKINGDAVYQHTYQKLHYQFVASARAIKAAHRIDSDYVVGSMACGVVNYPLTPDPRGILANRYAWKQNIFYCGGIRALGEYPSYSKRL